MFRSRISLILAIALALVAVGVLKTEELTGPWWENGLRLFLLWYWPAALAVVVKTIGIIGSGNGLTFEAHFVAYVVLLALVAAVQFTITEGWGYWPQWSAVLMGCLTTVVAYSLTTLSRR